MAEEIMYVFVRLPAELKREIDALVGSRKRGAFLAEAVKRELERRRLAAAKSEQIQRQEAAEERVSIN
jgi:metal-responsive CopG/Arc/MetJ family transcriptional regulator